MAHVFPKRLDSAVEGDFITLGPDDCALDGRLRWKKFCAFLSKSARKLNGDMSSFILGGRYRVSQAAPLKYWSRAVAEVPNWFS